MHVRLSCGITKDDFESSFLMFKVHRPPYVTLDSDTTYSYLGQTSEYKTFSIKSKPAQKATLCQVNTIAVKGFFPVQGNTDDLHI